jgi:hypothetical protein
VNKETIAFFEESLVPEAEGVLRLYIFLSLDIEGSRTVCKKFFKSAVDLIPTLRELAEVEQVRAVFYSAAYQFYSSHYKKSSGKGLQLDEDLSFLLTMRADDRLLLFLTEFAGIEEAYLDLIECDMPKGVRRKNLDEILRKIEGFEEKLGEAQLFFQSFQFELDDVFELKNFVRDPSDRQTEDFQRLEGVSKWQVAADFARRIALFAVLGAVAVALFFVFKPNAPGNTHSIDTLRFEMNAFAEYGRSRIDVPYESLAELESVLASSQSLLGFQVTVPKAEHPEWTMVGSSVLDYDTHRVLALVWSRKSNPSDLMIVFQFLADHFDPRPENNQRFEHNGISYTPYVSENSNILLWPINSSTFGVVFGTSSANDLGDFLKVVFPQG